MPRYLFANMICVALLSTLFGAVFVSSARAAESDTTTPPSTQYQKPELLVSPTELAELKGKAGETPLVLLNVTGQAALFNMHGVNPSEWKQAFGEGTDTEAWSQRLTQLGINDQAAVVVVDEGVTPNAARVWWILQYWGVSQARVLNGSWNEIPWRSGDYQPPKPTSFQAKPQADRLHLREEIMAIIAADRRSTACLLDTRSQGEFTRGAIPSAKRLEWVDMVDASTGKLKTADQLRELFSAAGLQAEQPVVTYCRSGGRASVVALAAEVLTGKPASNYHGSWNDWQSSKASPIKVPE